MKQLKVLYVDDDLINRKLLEHMLAKNPAIYETLAANDGQEALEVLNKNRDIDFVLLDIIMPKLNGIEVLKHMRKDPRFSQIPVIVLSTDDTQKRAALEAGANDFINKPIKKDDLMDKIKKYAEAL
ncbi:PleD family two-component system response regulator [Nitratiruptor sp. YY09-18]|uniref:response regulator n=1 Tax=Nitratiruptor sp. YY09-18 TaxID=2724901 RepID=UPI001915E3C0|nr:response regulator [Nitratiruptor sp. YY09-18]BCD67666.1 two-component system, chemotaxis family, chemotaxis protein CheY [Nitratiruptor sp. YY09-18]